MDGIDVKAWFLVLTPLRLSLDLISANSGLGVDNSSFDYNLGNWII